VLLEFNVLDYGQAIAMPFCREMTAMRIKVQYDAKNRTFKLVDSTFGTLLEGDALYDLAIPLSMDEDDDELLAPANGFVGRA
jgi:hypothetical protein